MKKRILAMLLAAILTLGSAAPALAYETSDFSDVPANHWAYAPIMEMVEQGVIKGVGGGRFDPNGKLTAEMFLTLIGRVIFPDVEANGEDWSGPYVEKAKAEGLLEKTAVTDETLKNEVTRYDVAEILRGAIDHTQIRHIVFTDKAHREEAEANAVDKRELADSIYAAEETVIDALTDRDSIPKERIWTIRSIYGAGLMTGDEKGNFNGGHGLTRMEAAVILQRFLTMRDAATLARQLKVERVKQRLVGMTSRPLAELSAEELADLLYELDPELKGFLREVEVPSYAQVIDTNELSAEEWKGILDDIGLPADLYSEAYNQMRSRTWKVYQANDGLGDMTAETIANASPEEWGGKLSYLNELDDRDFRTIVTERGFTARELIAAYRAADEAGRDKVKEKKAHVGNTFHVTAQIAVTAARVAQMEGIETLDIKVRGYTMFNDLLGMHSFDNDNIRLGLYGEDGRLIGEPKLTGGGNAVWELDMTMDTSNWDEVLTLKLLEPYYWPRWFNEHVGYRITPQETGTRTGTIAEFIDAVSISLRGEIY